MAEILRTLLSSPHAPSFIYLHHPHTPTSALDFEIPSNVRLARIDAIEHYNPRLLYSGIISQLGGDAGEISTWDGLVRALRDVVGERDEKGKGKGKGKGKARMNGNGLATGHEEEGERRVVVVITKAERLRNVLGGGWSVITRLAELVSWLYPRNHLIDKMNRAVLK
jgi:origin recognition complex subunit 5